MSNRNSNLISLLLLLIAVTLRFTRVLPNFEFVTTAMVISAAYLSRKHSLLLVLTIMAITDLILGNTRIFLFTWTGFLLPILLISSLGIRNSKLEIIKTVGYGLFSNLFFYAWTNLGVWILDSWGMYPKTLSGLISCYVNGLPFLKTQLESSLIFIPLTIAAITFVSKISTLKTKNPSFT